MNHTGCGRGLAGHMGMGVLADDCVQHRVRDLVAELVGMALGNRLGCKKLH